MNYYKNLKRAILFNKLCNIFNNAEILMVFINSNTPNACTNGAFYFFDPSAASSSNKGSLKGIEY